MKQNYRRGEQQAGFTILEALIAYRRRRSTAVTV